MTEQEVVKENAAYVLGMYDLYHNDEEIIDMLRLKGVNESLIPKIVELVQQPAYEKRVKQAKRNIFIGSLIFIVLFIIPYLLIRHYHITIDFAQDFGERMMKWLLEFYANFYYFFIIVSVVQVLTGITNYFKYKKLLKR